MLNVCPSKTIAAAFAVSKTAICTKSKGLILRTVYFYTRIMEATFFIRTICSVISTASIKTCLSTLGAWSNCANHNVSPLSCALFVPAKTVCVIVMASIAIMSTKIRCFFML